MALSPYRRNSLVEGFRGRQLSLFLLEIVTFRARQVLRLSALCLHI